MAAEEALLTGVGELLFSLLIGYLGALEFAFVARHLYHWTCRHPCGNEAVDLAADTEELPRMRERLDTELADAAAKEAAAGTNVMQDGIRYTNGFRMETAADKRAALAAELERQRRIEEDTRKQLEEAEVKLGEERSRAKRERLAAEAAEAAESARKLLEAEKQREAEQREREEREENERKLLEAERRRIEEQERQERETNLLEAERKRVEEEQQQRQENERKLIEAERQREAEQRALERLENELREAEERRELEENERILRKAEAERQEAQRQRELAEAEAERRVLEIEAEQAKRDEEIVERLLAAERERKMSATESELEEEALIQEQSRQMAASKDNKLEKKQRSIEENARLFMEAEEEMVMLQQRMLQAAQDREDAEYAGAIPVVEEPCIKKILPPRFDEPPVDEPLLVQRVKTQFGQSSGGEEPYKSKTLMFPSVSDEGSSLEPNSSQQSSFSTQPSEERTHLMAEEERQEPEGEDNVPDVQYTEDYLRSLDGIKSRPLMREDGSGRRRAFKKRRSSGSSNSSRESRASRDEELKMFTSLEEEELRHGDKADYNPIKYTSEPTLRVKSHHRRHKRSPAKDANPPPDAGGSLEMLGEESTNPWGEVVPEHYKDTEFWKREKALSIDEEEFDLGKIIPGAALIGETQNEPKASSFEEASEEQNALAANTLLRRSKEDLDKDSTESSKTPETTSSDIKSNLQTSQTTEEQSRRGSPGLRRSPRMGEMDHYEERWRESEAASHSTSSPPPSITIHEPDTAPWRDQYGLMMEGLSDFYDFTASVNPSRSRSTSRNASPQPKNVANRMDVDNKHTLEVYDDTEDGVIPGELNCELVLEMLESTINGNGTEMTSVDQLQLQNVADDCKNGSSKIVPMIYEPVEDQNGLEEQIEPNDRLMEALPIQTNSPTEVESNSNPIDHVDSEGSNAILPQPVIEINLMADDVMENGEPVPTREEMRLFVESRRAERNSGSQSRSRSRSRSRSPLPTSDNIARSLETRRLKRIKQTDEFFEKLEEEQKSRSQSTSPIPIPAPIPIISVSPPPPMPTISIEMYEEPTEHIKQEEEKEEKEEQEDTPESMAKLFEKLRLDRCRSHSRSRSKSPLPTAANMEHSLQKRRERLIAQNDAFFEQLRATTPEPERRFTVEHVTEYIEAEDSPEDNRNMRSLSPSRSISLSSESNDYNEDANDFHIMLNLEGSEKRTLLKKSEELESVLANSAKQREVDLEALQKLTNANEEVELRVMSPTGSDYTHDYERTMSEMARDLKDEIMVGGFKRSTYVGESLDLGSEFEQLRREEAQFQRSRSPSPSIDLSVAREQAAAQRELQSAILNSLVTASEMDNEKRLGAKPKTSEYEHNFAEELKDTQRMKEESLASGFKRSTYVGESMDLGITAQLDDLRHRTAEFQRSRSQSRSPVREDDDLHALKNIEAEVAKRELQDQLLDHITASSANYNNFSRYLNVDFLDKDRRASDSAIILDPNEELEPEEYHHFRRFSLAQEQPIEEYPNDEFVCISQIEVRSMTGMRTWLKEDFYTHELSNLEIDIDETEEDDADEPPKKSEYCSEGSWARAVLAAEAEAAEFDETSAIYNFDILRDYQGNDDGSTNDSDDERQTVVEIDEDEEYEFELDEGISDNNERTQPTDESHHDTSECEEAERNADRYANSGANDWEEVDNVNDFADYGIDDGAVGGTYSDPDSFIEQIYNDAVKNRKQSGILRDYETMIEEQLRAENADQSESDKELSGSDNERYALWAKTRELSRSEERSRHRDVDISLGLLESERRDTEMRYLGDAHGAARQSARLRTRYGYSPKLQTAVVDDDIDVDLNYRPKREYNWRKNFKLDDNETQRLKEEKLNAESLTDEDQIEMLEEDQDPNETNLGDEPIPTDELMPVEDVDPSLCDIRRFSLGGESITLFSRSPMRELLTGVPEESMPEAESEALNQDREDIEAELAPIEEKPKKKKSKKKMRKGSKTEEELRDDNDSDNQEYNRRNSSVKDDMDMMTDAPKRKTRSRRSSKSGSTAEEMNGGLFSPRNSVGFVGDALEGIAELETSEDVSQKKKTKKRKKTTKESKVEQIQVQPDEQELDEALVAALAKIAPISLSASTNLTPASTQQNLLSSISAGNSVCLTPASSIEDAISSTLSENNNTIAVASTAAVPARSVVDTFDILKDANFYPLF